MNFILVTGPPAVGKMTVGQTIADKLGYKIFTNHDSIEFALKYFYFGETGFKSINEGIRQLVFENTSKSKELKGMIFTLVWAFDMQEDWDYVERIKKMYMDEGWNFYIVELYAPIETRLSRNSTPHRLAMKPSKRNIELSNSNLQKTDEEAQVSSGGSMVKDENYMYIDNTDLTAEEVTQKVIERFGFKIE